MGTLTRVMGRTVYGIDLQDPPLEKLTERGKVKKFKRKVTSKETNLKEHDNSKESSRKPHSSSGDTASEKQDIPVISRASSEPYSLRKTKSIEEKTSGSQSNSNEQKSIALPNNNENLHDQGMILLYLSFILEKKRVTTILPSVTLGVFSNEIY